MMQSMENVVVKLQDWMVLYGLNVIAALLIMVIGWFAAKIIRSIVRRVLEKSRFDVTLASFVSNICYVAIVAFVVIASLGKLGVQTTSFVAVLGAAGLAIGLALQGSLANFAAGFLMIIFKPFKAGDYIEGAGVAGVVEEVGVFTTELRSMDNKKIIIPNAKMTGDNIINYSAKPVRRIDMVASVGYDEDLDKVKRVLADILAKDDRILKDPAPTIGVLELADSSIDFAVRPWVKTSDYWSVFFDTQENIMKRFNAEDICVPYPQRDVHIYNAQ